MKNPVIVAVAAFVAGVVTAQTVWVWALDFVEKVVR